MVTFMRIGISPLDCLALAPAVASLLAYVAAAILTWLAVRAERKKPVRAEPTPRVSIFKPLAGMDDELADNLASFGRLSYPNCELLLGVASRKDPAYAVARRFFADHPSVEGRLVLTNPNAAKNPKVAQLLALERRATGSIFVIADSNVRVEPDYLAPLVRELSRPGVAATSSVIVGDGERTVGAAVENLQLGGTVAPLVVALYELGHAVTVGKSLAMRRTCVEAIGGLCAVADVLAEDYVLGDLFSRAGFVVTVCRTPVRNRNVSCSLDRTIERHVRWAKLRRSIRPSIFALEPLLNPIVIATLAMLVRPVALTAGMLLVAALVQTATAFLSLRLLRGHAPRLAWAPLEILRSYVAAYCWSRAWLSREVSWRGHRFMLAESSRIIPLPVRAITHATPAVQ
jgi:ceramide glucosyltransferase